MRLLEGLNFCITFESGRKPKKLSKKPKKAQIFVWKPIGLKPILKQKIKLKFRNKMRDNWSTKFVVSKSYSPMLRKQQKVYLPFNIIFAWSFAKWWIFLMCEKIFILLDFIFSFFFYFHYKIKIKCNCV
jgi:hypothetical protein